jgi:hypothetical protein
VRGEVTEKKFDSHRLYTYRELHGLLSRAGFVDLQSFGSIGGEPYAFGASGLLIVACKGS